MLSVVDERIPSSSLSYLKSISSDIILMRPFDKLQKPIASHPDMLYIIIGNTLITHKDYYKDNSDNIDIIAKILNISLLITDEYCASDYPHDVLFNAVVIGNSLICNPDTISTAVIDIAKQNSIHIIETKQGYSKCSTCVVDGNSIITSDKGIAIPARNAGIEVFYIRPGYIKLTGYETGFIGGATGKYLDKIFFCGSLESHPDARAINSFCNIHGKTAISLSKDKLYDVGTMYFY